ncbi:hypothetical protein [Comamonas denitrificans]|nr:hypothetical protein [Comamonas sp.]HRN31971.1 hypothetical protein [Comamonas denitrificans]
MTTQPDSSAALASTAPMRAEKTADKRFMAKLLGYLGGQDCAVQCGV